MLVRDHMTRRPITVTEDTSVSRALQMMKDEDVRRFPVVNKRGKLVGIVLEKDLIYASPSAATTLSVFEVHTLLAKLKVSDVMTEEVITVTEDTPLEDAARIMADNNVGGLPVMRDGDLVGIITETDLFKVFLEMLGGRDSGLRISMRIPHVKGTLVKIAGKIAGMGGNILALGTIRAEDPAHYQLTVKVADVEKDPLLDELREIDIDDLEILDVRET